MSSATPGPRIAIVGVGQVGGAAANALILGSVARELLLVDVKIPLRNAQVQELSDVSNMSGGAETRIRAGTYEEAGQCDIVVITAGSKYSVGETSVQHMYRNMGIVQKIIPAMRPFRPDTILLVVSNPVDLLTTVAQQLSGLPPTQVLGSGTLLESVRLRGLVAKTTGVAPDSVDLYVLGVHGIGETVAWSTATVGGLSLARAIPPNSLDPIQLARECRQISQTIIHAKGAIPLGTGAIISKVCSSILRDQRDIYPISHYQEDFGCCFSLPVIIGRKGILRTIRVAANAEEWDGITKSARDLNETIQHVKEGA
ncbi:lactate/malate dehydrogenase family protein [Aspergillus clavatus NRRL 1]|uniref:L-lactate dehydrogenase n=1 Tax=Aspergillus clavatus (strain ATCC 1007 / CBS 513.65 / DSM 816 / NCTC 3887 / NRRL 1 / QM 1276 / 107) TaxID=344612 RepID=A1C5Q5_ASPCL|nr:l-lactate dehydrogenase [Aspergillus clavatus NRRL 1]EAW15023.1 l-lactate dehydrogenase [Aspergillus clavatus NRRL 1]